MEYIIQNVAFHLKSALSLLQHQHTQIRGRSVRTKASPATASPAPRPRGRGVVVMRARRPAHVQGCGWGTAQWL